MTHGHRLSTVDPSREPGRSVKRKGRQFESEFPAWRWGFGTGTDSLKGRAGNTCNEDLAINGQRRRTRLNERESSQLVRVLAIP